MCRLVLIFDTDNLLEFFFLDLILANLPTLCKMIAEKNLVATVGIEPRPLAQESDTILTELTWQVLNWGSLNSLLLVHQLTFGLG